MLYLTAIDAKLDTDEGRFRLVVSTDDIEDVTIDLHGIDLDRFYESVRNGLGGYLREAHEARQAVAAGVSLSAFLCMPEDVDESGGWAEAMRDNADWSRKVAKGE